MKQCILLFAPTITTIKTYIHICLQQENLNLS